MAINYAQFVENSAYLSTEFGKSLAMRKFNLTEQQLENIVGRYTRGKRKDLLRGCLIWIKCIKGGWVKTGPYNWDIMQADGYIEKPNITKEYRIIDSWTHEQIYPLKS